MLVNKRNKKKLKGLFMKLEIIALLSFLLWFTIKILELVESGFQEPPSLIIAVFGFCGLEGGILGWIKVTDKKKKKDNTSEGNNI